jgi:hypothetical protein
MGRVEYGAWGTPGREIRLLMSEEAAYSLIEASLRR